MASVDAVKDSTAEGMLRNKSIKALVTKAQWESAGCERDGCPSNMRGLTLSPLLFIFNWQHICAGSVTTLVACVALQVCSQRWGVGYASLQVCAELGDQGLLGG